MKFTLIVSILIIIAVLIPGSNLPSVGLVGVDKAIHFIMFLTWAIAWRTDRQVRFNFLWALTSGVVFSLFTELIQILIEGRTFDLYDLIADALGLITGLLIGGWLLTLIEKRIRK